MKNLIQIVIASRNVHKIREYREIFRSISDFDILSLLDFPEYVPLKEEGKSFKENAVNKAVFAAKTLNKLVIGDDSGLVVPSLNGKPGIYSSRYAGENASDSDNRKKLLQEMEGFEGDKRRDYCESCIALASAEGLKNSSCATCEGMILKEGRGGGGFGYDPLFVKHEYSKTFAELDSSIKNKISHRRKALDKIMPYLEVLTV